MKFFKTLYQALQPLASKYNKFVVFLRLERGERAGIALLRPTFFSASNLHRIGRIEVGSKAWEAGIRNNDRIMTINHILFSDMTQRDLAPLYNLNEPRLIRLCILRQKNLPLPVNDEEHDFVSFEEYVSFKDSTLNQTTKASLPNSPTKDAHHEHDDDNNNDENNNFRPYKCPYDPSRVSPLSLLSSDSMHVMGISDSEIDQFDNQCSFIDRRIDYERFCNFKPTDLSP